MAMAFAINILDEVVRATIKVASQQYDDDHNTSQFYNDYHGATFDAYTYPRTMHCTYDKCEINDRTTCQSDNQSTEENP